MPVYSEIGPAVFGGADSHLSAHKIGAVDTFMGL